METDVLTIVYIYKKTDSLLAGPLACSDGCSDTDMETWFVFCCLASSSWGNASLLLLSHNHGCVLYFQKVCSGIWINIYSLLPTSETRCSSVVHTGLELTVEFRVILLPQSSECWDYRLLPPYLLHIGTRCNETINSTGGYPQTWYSNFCWCDKYPDWKQLLGEKGFIWLTILGYLFKTFFFLVHVYTCLKVCRCVHIYVWECTHELEVII